MEEIKRMSEPEAVDDSKEAVVVAACTRLISQPYYNRRGHASKNI